MNNPFPTIVADGSIAQVLKLTASASKFELDTAAQKVPEDQLHKIGVWTSSKLRVRGVEATLVSGCLLHLYRLVTTPENRQALFTNMLDELGLSSTQAYRCIAVWNSFGQVLSQEPKLTSQFVSESLKLLAAEQAQPLARDAAIELARKGERISIKRAEELLREFAVTDEQTPEDLPSENETATEPSHASNGKQGNKSTKSSWSFVGKVVRLVIKPTGSIANIDLPSIVRDLETVIEKLRREFGQSENQSGSADAA